jgi:hypothetical protein
MAPAGQMDAQNPQPAQKWASLTAWLSSFGPRIFISIAHSSAENCNAGLRMNKTFTSHRILHIAYSDDPGQKIISFSKKTIRRKNIRASCQIIRDFLCNPIIIKRELLSIQSRS